MINIRMQDPEVKKLSPKITVVGVGGAGGNAVNNMISSGLQGVDLLVCNTDAQALEHSLCDIKLQLGVSVTGGLGAGARPEVGSEAAEESLDEVLQHLEGSNMVFITAGMGGGTGTGAAPVIARAAREKGILTVGVVTKPFHFEGTLRMKMAEQGIEEMQEYVDTLIVIPNQNLFRIANEKTTFSEAFKMADSVLQSAVRGVTDLMVRPGDINLDFADIRSVMLEMGKAMMGTGESSGERRATEAAEKAINNPLLDDVSMKGARAVIINVTGGHDMTLFEVDEACNRIRDEVDPNANIIFGSCYDDALEGVMRVSIVATGIDVADNRSARPTVDQNPAKAQGQSRPSEEVAPTDQPSGQATPPAQAWRSPPGASLPPLPLNVRPATSAARHVADISRPSVTGEQSSRPQETSEGTEAVTVPQSTGQPPRGQVYNSAFIPPRPVEAGESHTPAPRYEREGDMLSLSATRSESAMSANEGSSLVLKPPAVRNRAAEQQEQRRKTASLFERFTSQLRGSLSEGDEDREETGRAGKGSAGSGSIKTNPPTQGSLNIEASHNGDDGDDELDIPAFLRRQAN